MFLQQQLAFDPQLQVVTGRYRSSAFLHFIEYFLNAHFLMATLCGMVCVHMERIEFGRKEVFRWFG